MESLCIETEQLRLEIAPQVGASIVAFEVKRGGERVPIMRPTPPPLPEKSSNYSSFILAPYSNRIRAARFEFEGYTYQLEPNTPEGNTQHGDVRGRPWQVFYGASSAAGTFDSRFFEDVNWPWPFSLAVLYRLEGHTLETTLELVNQGQSPMPAGFGLHPYFVRSLGEAVMQFGARGFYQTDASFIPHEGMQPIPGELDFSWARPVGTQPLNHVYGGWDGRAVLEWAGSNLRLLLEADPVFEHLVVFTAPDGTLALEPVTNATDGFNLYARGIQGTGVRVLQPEESLAGKVRMTIAEL
ncbi:aldose 1-epimerase [uncultured Meiothermus sp.]|jgi:aldose 1-epimerase|uniref:aldose 1-epimerase n=1 Tax=uncultured Meiothermus sp. TaxID=157471 RepID=UPI002621A7BF|nr:aldose 1-epimerase [uncultured Meiothermus sp.]